MVRCVDLVRFFNQYAFCFIEVARTRNCAELRRWSKITFSAAFATAFALATTFAAAKASTAATAAAVKGHLSCVAPYWAKQNEFPIFYVLSL